MKSILRQFRQILLTSTFALYAVTAISQVKNKTLASKPVIKKSVSPQLKDFYRLTADANVVFFYPTGFKEIPVINNDDFSYDYAMELPGHEFELWFQIKSQKQSDVDYQRLKNDPTQQIASPDSLYNDIGRAQATTFTGGDQNYLTRIIPQDILARYNADAGKTYLLNLHDREETKHYKYALLITLQKDHVGTIVAVCFGNDKGAEFFKNINRVSKSLKFKP